MMILYIFIIREDSILYVTAVINSQICRIAVESTRKEKRESGTTLLKLL
jgi:hypothetical protein